MTTPARPMAFTSVFIVDRQHPHGPAVHGRTGDEVPRPHLTSMLRLGRQSRRDSTTRYSSIPWRNVPSARSAQTLYRCLPATKHSRCSNGAIRPEPVASILPGEFPRPPLVQRRVLTPKLLEPMCLVELTFNCLGSFFPSVTLHSAQKSEVTSPLPLWLYGRYALAGYRVFPMCGCELRCYRNFRLSLCRSVV